MHLRASELGNNLLVTFSTTVVVVVVVARFHVAFYDRQHSVGGGRWWRWSWKENHWTTWKGAAISSRSACTVFFGVVGGVGHVTWWRVLVVSSVRACEWRGSWSRKVVVDGGSSERSVPWSRECKFGWYLSVRCMHVIVPGVARGTVSSCLAIRVVIDWLPPGLFSNGRWSLRSFGLSCD